MSKSPATNAEKERQAEIAELIASAIVRIRSTPSINSLKKPHIQVDSSKRRSVYG